MTAGAWPVYDTGLRAGPENVALDRQLFAACRDGAYTGNLRWHGFLPTASLGLHEDAARSVRGDYCASHGIGVVRRVTGGGSLYLDPQQFCFSLIFSPPPDWPPLSLALLMQRLSDAVAGALQDLGIGAKHVHPNDLEVDGRKIGATFISREHDCVLFQGTLLLGVDIETLLTVLRLPTEKLSPQGMRTARERLATLADCGSSAGKTELAHALQRRFSLLLGVRFSPDTPPVVTPDRVAKDHTPEDDLAPLSGAWTAFVKTAGGVLYAELRAENDRLADARFTGAVHLEPAGLLRDLAARLSGLPLEQAAVAIDTYLSETPCDFIGTTAADIGRVTRLALDRGREQAIIGLDTAQANALMVHSPAAGEPIDRILGKAGAVLVPYCAKPVWCKWRHRDGCVECGLCEVGDAYRLARERGLRVTTITNYEHLVATLAELRAEGVESYVGMCCGNFFLKRQHAFTDAGLPAVLVDISGSNCYELRQESQAYAGEFKAQAQLQLDVVEKVMQWVPARTKDKAPED